MRDNDKTSILTDPPPKPKGYRTGVRLRVISQEPFGIEFHRIGVGSRVVQNPPVCQVKSRRGEDRIERELREGSSSFLQFAHQMFASTADPLGIK